jgi:hypothetical protein
MPLLTNTKVPGTGIRLVDDLLGAGPVPGAAPPTTPQMRAATTYEKYVQPAVLGLRGAVTKVFGEGADDQFGGLDASADAAGPAGLGAKLAVKAGLGVLGKFIDLPRGTVLKHGGPELIETVRPERFNRRSVYGRALYTSEDEAIARQYAEGAAKAHGGGAHISEFHVNRDMPVWDATDVVPSDIDRFAPHLLPTFAEAARKDPRLLPEIVRSEIHEGAGDLLERVGVSGVRFPHQGSTALAITPEALHRGLVTAPTGERVTDEGRRRVAEMMAGLQQARSR